jgi:hypothetical protein
MSAPAPSSTATARSTETIKGTTYFVFGGACYRPFYSGSSVIYDVAAKPA